MTFALLLFVAHDFWIEPTSFAPAAGTAVVLRLRVGQEMMGEPVAFDPAAVKRFVSSDGTRIIARRGTDRGLLVATNAPQIVAYESLPGAPLELDAAKFTDYLKEEGLEAIAAQRQRAGQASKPAREVFARCAKTLLNQPRDRALGLPLELVAGSPGGVQLLYQGQPLANALVVAQHKLDPAKKQALRSGVDGRVRFALREPGLWMIKAVHMIPAPAGQNAEWLSYWASLTFEIQP